MKRAGGLARVLGLFAVALTNAVADEGYEIGRGIDQLPLFDAHVHYKREAWEPFPPETVLTLMDQAGVAMALVSSTPDEGTVRLWEFAPARIVPELRPYHGEWGSSNWVRAPAMLDYLVQRIEAYPHRGIGEFHINRVDPADRPLFERVAALALRHGALLHIHSDAEAVRMIYDIEPRLTVIWAHAGMTEEPQVIGEMMERYPSLYADTSYREMDILAGGIEVIDADWDQLITRFSDRFMIGSDTWVNGQWEAYAEIIAENRRWLSHFPRAIAERIAYRNAERLFDRPVERSLIGQRRGR